MKRAFAAIFLIALLVLGGGRVARADEPCPGCYGKGKIGCGRCLSSGMGAFVGVCHTCGGFYAQTFRAKQRMVGALSWDPSARNVILVALSPGGTVSVIKGIVESSDDGVRLTLDVNGAHLVWAVPAGGTRIDWTVDVATGSGDERKVVEKGVDRKD